MLLRTILLLLLLFLLWLWLRRQWRRWLDDDDAAPPPPADKHPVHMLRCEHCGLHVPAREAVSDGERIFCCEQHRDLARRKSP